MGGVASAADFESGCANIDVADCDKLPSRPKSRKAIYTLLRLIIKKWGSPKTSEYYRIEDFK